MENNNDKRRHSRFRPDGPAYALIDTDPSGTSFKPGFGGLVIDESYGGCGLAVLSKSAIKIDDTLKVKISELPMTEAQVRWMKKLDSEVSRIGLRNID
jgi:hypothetical protein